MKYTRLISRLDIKGPNLVKGVHLEGLRVLGKPENFAKYYYKKFNLECPDYKNLKIKITEEVNLSVQAAQKVLECAPGTDVEVHVDIGTNKENKTRSMMNVVSGWVSGMGFGLKVKPYSWASSSIADNHTK